MAKNNVELLKFAESFLGKGGSIFRSYCGLGSGQPWCCAYVRYIFSKGGDGNLFYGNKNVTYCPSALTWCRANLAEIPIYLALPSDIIFFDWNANNVPDHIGLVRERKSDQEVYTIEGNTSGGIVANRVRPNKYVIGCFRPAFKATWKDAPLVIDGYFGYNSIAMLQKALKKKGMYSDTIDGILGKNTVRGIQKLCGVTQDGSWGVKTSKAMQKFLGVKVDGAWGANSTKALQTWINKTNGSQPSASKTVYIGQATRDYDGKAGDSSGKEVTKSVFQYVSSSSSPYNWTYIFRPKDPTKAEKAASMCEKAIANNNIGYNKRGETAYGKDRAMTKLAKAVNYDLSKVRVKCGLSCGDLICLCNRWAGLSTCYIGSGLQLANKYKENSNFICIPYKKGMTLKRGDTLITAHSNGKHNHVAMVL